MSQAGVNSSTGGGSGAVDSVTGVGNIVASPTTGDVVVSSNGLQLFRGPTINFQVVGLTTLFTPTAIFLPQLISIYAANITGVISQNEVFNIGWQAPDYEQIITTQSSSIITTGSYTTLIPNVGIDQLAVPASTPLVINITTPAISSGDDFQRVDVWGYYL